MPVLASKLTAIEALVVAVFRHLGKLNRMKYRGYEEVEIVPQMKYSCHPHLKKVINVDKSILKVLEIVEFA